MLTNSNGKLGKSIYSFNLPRTSCKEKTKACQKYCYGRRGFFRCDNTIKNMDGNLKISKSDLFVEAICAQIHYIQVLENIEYIRLHACGDFYSQDYYNKWQKIAGRYPDVKFLAYTRNTKIDFSKRPDNFMIINSRDATTKKLNPTLDRYAWVLDKKKIPNEAAMNVETRPAFICRFKCSNCKMCWGDNGLDIVFPQK